MGVGVTGISLIIQQTFVKHEDWLPSATFPSLPKIFWNEAFLRCPLQNKRLIGHFEDAPAQQIQEKSSCPSPNPVTWWEFRWAAANGGVTNGGLRGVWPPFPESAEIGPFRPFSAFFALFRRVRRAPGKSRKRRKKTFFLRYPRISLNPHLLNPHLWHPNFGPEKEH